MCRKIEIFEEPNCGGMSFYREDGSKVTLSLNEYFSIIQYRSQEYAKLRLRNEERRLNDILPAGLVTRIMEDDKFANAVISKINELDDEDYDDAFLDYVQDAARDALKKNGKFLIEDGVLTYAVSDESTIIVPDGVKVVDSRAFCDLESLSKVILPESVTEIRLCAFVRCPSLKLVATKAPLEKRQFFLCRTMESILSEAANA